MGNGSDEALNFAFLAYAADGRGGLADITYGFYPVFAELYHIPVQTVPLREDFTPESGGLLRPAQDHRDRQSQRTHRNSPEPDSGGGILQANPDCVVVLDEAYVDFGRRGCVPHRTVSQSAGGADLLKNPGPWPGRGWAMPSGTQPLIQDLETIKFSTNPIMSTA